MNKKFDMGAPFKLVVALGIGAIAAFVGGELMPLTIGVLTDGFKFSLEQAGVLLSAEGLRASSVTQVRNGRGRDGPFGPPPAQIPASGTTALGSYLG